MTTDLNMSPFETGIHTVRMSPKGYKLAEDPGVRDFLMADPAQLSTVIQSVGAAHGWTGWTVLAWCQLKANDFPMQRNSGIMGNWQDQHVPLSRELVERSWDQPVPFDRGKPITAHGLWTLMAYLHLDRAIRANRTQNPIVSAPESWPSESFRASFPQPQDIPALLDTTHALISSHLNTRADRQSLAYQMLSMLHPDLIAQDENEAVKGPWLAFRKHFASQPAAVQFRHLDQWFQVAHTVKDRKLEIPDLDGYAECSAWHQKWMALMQKVQQEGVPISKTQARRQLGILTTQLTHESKRAKKMSRQFIPPSTRWVRPILECLHARRPEEVVISHWIKAYAAVPYRAGEPAVIALKQLQVEVVARERQVAAGPLVAARPDRARARP